MTEAVTLELSEEVMRRAREVAQRTGRTMADVLTEWLHWAAMSDGTTFLVSDASYAIYTPYGSETLTQDLLDALSAYPTTERTGEPPR